MRYISVAALFLLMSAFAIESGPPCPPVRLFEKAPFPVGTALNVEKLKYEERYWSAAIEHFNSFTPEKIMKPRFIQPHRNEFHFAETDHLIDFCRQRSIRLHGHALVWHRELPRWMEKFKGTPEEWDLMLKTHIQTVVGHCRSYVNSWDVVNEAFDDNGSLRDNVWLQNIGPAYIAKAFRYAQEGNPDAQLFYNDYSLEQGGPKLRAVLQHMKKLRAEGVRIDGIGMQMHVTLEMPSNAQIESAAREIAEAGFTVHYSELDVSLGGHSLFEKRKELEARQKERVEQIVRGYLKLPADKRFGITLWGVSDNDSWLTDENLRARPLLLDKRYRLKPAFCGFAEALEN